jgi:hypothetical protein
MVLILSIAFLNFFAYESVFQADINYRISVFVVLIVLAYLMAALVVSFVLIALDKFTLITEPAVALKRLIIIPASMGLSSSIVLIKNKCQTGQLTTRLRCQT